MRKYRLFFLLLVAILGGINVYAQQYQVKGKVVRSSSNKPIEFVNATLIRNDSIYRDTVTDSLGGFTMAAPEGDYTLKLEYLGEVFTNKEVSISSDVDLGILKIQESVQLQKVVIKAKKKLIERKVDRLVFNVENTVSAHGGDALDALKITSGLKVQNDQISMIGKNGISVMIDDRLMQLSGDDLINFLKTIKSDDIKNIEVITTPPAKYEAEGNGGIINIKLKKNKANGWSNTIRTTYKQATYPSFSIGNNLMYKKNKFNILFDIGYRSNQDIYTNDIQYNFSLNYLQQSVFEKSNTNGITGAINIGYKVNEKLQLGLQYSGFSTDTDKKSNNINNVIIYQNPHVKNILLSEGMTDQKYHSNSLNFNAIKKISNSDNKVVFDIDYFNLNTNRFNNLNSDDFTAVDNNNLRKIENISSKIDFDIPNKWANLSFGAKISFTETNNDIDISRYNIINQKPKSIYNQLDYFTYNENIQGIYFSANRKFGTKWEGKVGLRTEFTQSKGYSKTENKTNINKYIKFFPTVYLSYLLNRENTFTLSYGRRVNRPSYSNLNPARWYLTPTSYEEGNPFLQPSFTSNFELSHSYRNFLTTTVSFSKTEDGFGQLTIHDIKDNIQAFVRRNYYNYSLFSLSEYINHHIFPWWTASVEGSLYYTETNTYTKYLKPKYSGWGGYFSTTNSFIFNKNKTILAQLTYEYNYPTIFNENKIEEYSSLGIGVKLLLNRKKLQIAINANNILGTDRIKASNTTQGVYQTFKQYYDTQYIRLSLSYKFGNKDISGDRRKTSNEDEKGRSN